MVNFNLWRYISDGAELGTGAFDVVVDDGSFYDIPDSVVSLYDFEDDSDTSVALDSRGTNDLDILSAGSYSTDSPVGSLSLSTNGNGRATESQQTIDPALQGDTDGFGFMAWVKPDSSGSTEYAFGLGNSESIAYCRLDGDYTTIFETSNGFEEFSSGVSIDTSKWVHEYVEITQSDVSIYIDGTLEASQSHSLDTLNFGSATIYTGTNSPKDNTPYSGGIDDFAIATDPLNDTELQNIVDRGN